MHLICRLHRKQPPFIIVPCNKIFRLVSQWNAKDYWHIIRVKMLSNYFMVPPKHLAINKFRNHLQWAILSGCRGLLCNTPREPRVIPDTYPRAITNAPDETLLENL